MAIRLGLRPDSAELEVELRHMLGRSFGSQIRRPDRRFDAAQGTEVIFYKAMVYTVGPADFSGAVK